jgi:predicted AlkP superfamily pyrophosphatase or phosphodiesterase
MSNNPITFPDYKNSILNVSNSLLAYYNVPPHHDTHPVMDRYLQKDYNHVIYVLLDGLGSNIIHKHLNKDDALYKYLEKDITSVFPPTTVAATNAVLSGKSPIETGYLGWVQYFPKEDTNMIVFKHEDFYTGVKQDDLRQRYLKYDSIIDQINAYNPNINTRLFMPQIVDNTGPASFEEQVERVLLHTHHHDQTFSYVYWTEPDLTQHKEGTYSKHTEIVLKELNQTFTSLISNIPDNTIVIAIADHGLTNVRPCPLYEHDDITSLLLRKTSIEPRATNFFVKPDQLETFEKRFNDHFGDHFKLYSKDELFSSNLLGTGHKHPMIDSFIGDYVAIATGQYLFTLTENSDYKAHHAGLTQDEMMVPLIIFTK